MKLIKTLALSLAGSVILTTLLFAAATHTGDKVFSGGRLSFGAGGAFDPPATTVASLPVSPAGNPVYIVTDCTAEDDCSTGGGSALEMVRWNGSAYVVVTTGAGGAKRTLYAVSFGNGTTSSTWTSTVTGNGCLPDSGTSVQTVGLIGGGGLQLNATGNEGFECHGMRIPEGVDLSKLAVSVEGMEQISDTDAWDVNFQFQCLADNEAAGSWSATLASITIAGAGGGSGVQAAGIDNTVDLSGICAQADVLYIRGEIGSGSTAVEDIVISGFAIYEI